MNQFCKMKGIKREFSVARTSQQNGVAKRKNRTLIEAARTMLADSKLPTTFWAKAVNTACYVQNRNQDSRRDLAQLTKSMNYKPVVAGNQSNGSACTKACDNAGKARVEIVPGKDYILLPLLTQDSPFSSSSKDSLDARFKPSGDEENKDAKVLEKESEVSSKEDDQDDQDLRDDSTVNTASINDNVVDENIVYGCKDDPNIPNLEEIVYSNDDEDVGAETDMTNLDIHIPVSPIPTTRIHKDYLVEQIIRDIHSAPQTRRMKKHVTTYGMFSLVQQRSNHIDSSSEQSLEL
ncbi:ribonuclease H-like domain-containing protein [Tanacetum coccineum]|uniref:Ribonuclease H-like domain-containing protein n=1 Tax=Tanacetum coccineum TaxID=301880 RepID=A0ABQ4YBF9_9ASTR